MYDAAGLALLERELNDRLGVAAVVGHDLHCGQASLAIDPDHNRAVLSELRERHGYNFLSSLHGADYLPAKPRFAVHYEMLAMARVERICVKALVEDPGHSQIATIASVVDLFATADFQEREVYDFFGIAFDGHPDLRRILMPEEYVGFPQRRDFPIGGDPVIFTYDEDSVPGWTK